MPAESDSAARGGLAVDPEARRDAAAALAAAEQAVALFTLHDKHCDERELRASDSRAELAGAINRLAEKQSATSSRIHSRLDRLLWAVIGGFGALILLLAAYFIKTTGV